MMEFDPVLVHDWLSRSAKRFPDKTALVVGQGRWTYASLDRKTDILARTLCHMGLQHQDRVVIFLDNSSETVISLYGTLKAGGVFVNLAGSLKSRKLRYILDNSGARFLIAHTSKARIVEEALDSVHHQPSVIWAGVKKAIPKRLTPISMSWSEVVHEDCDMAVCNNGHTQNKQTLDIDLASLIYTSGSTGEPKGVMSTHHNMISAARSIIQYIGNQMDDIILNVLPLSFDYGLYQVIMAFMFGGTVVLERSFLFPHNILTRIAQERVTGFPIVPTIVAMLLRMQDVSKYDLGTLRYLTNTGAALPVEHIRLMRELLPHVAIFSMFGLTECKRVSYLSPDELDHRPGSVGKAMPNCAVAIIDENGHEVGPDQVGELVIRGANVMQGYWGDDELTARVYRKGAYPAERLLYSGDYFKKDNDGFLYFLGRKDDMIKCKGERVSAKEIENCICTLEGVVEAAVVGLPDEIFGQAIKVFIVRRDVQSLTEQDILRHCSQQMEAYMIPKYVEFLDELPKTTNGKINKMFLKNSKVTKHENTTVEV